MRGIQFKKISVQNRVGIHPVQLTTDHVQIQEGMCYFPYMDDLKDAQASEALEWARLVYLTADEARSIPGKGLLECLLDPACWAPDVTIAALMQQETFEASLVTDRDALWGPLADLEDPVPALDKLGKDSVLAAEDLVLLRSWLFAAESWAEVPKEEIRGERLWKSIVSLADPRQPLRTLLRVLTSEGAINENATPRLASLSAELRTVRAHIMSELENVLHQLSAKGVLQDNFSDVYEGRHVIPVKTSCQGDVEGNIHGASVSRQTVFIEPASIAALGNRLRRLENDREQEIHEILKEASARLRPFESEIRNTVDILAHWDSVQARARIARKYGGKQLHVTMERTFAVKSTAHPLLWWSLAPDSIVRNDIGLGPPACAVLLSGPNTGGKTVLLKTLGLAAVSARTGFMIPATGIPVVPFFDSIYADLGDPQSLEHSLSSFAGHMLRFREMLGRVTPSSLVLIDELNTATDPAEGAALGRAVLETLMARGAMVVVTTHDPLLKAASTQDARILNASMAFDETSRTPTYRLATGVPGRSRAIETAERLGLPGEVTALARSYLTDDHRRFEKVLAKFESETCAVERARKEAEYTRAEAERMRDEWNSKTVTAASDMLERARQKIKRILEQAQDELREHYKRLGTVRTRKALDEAAALVEKRLTAASDGALEAIASESPEIASVLEQKKAEDADTGGEALSAGRIISGMPARIHRRRGYRHDKRSWGRSG